MKVREIMTSGVISVPEDSTVEDAARTLARHRISGLPVVNAAGGLVGLVTEYDLISKQGHSVAEIMSRGVISVTEDTDVEEVSHLLANRRIRRVPVLRGPEPPEQCPRCHAKDVFTHQTMNPGM